MELKKLIKNTSYLAGTSVFNFVAGVFRAKINAVILGPNGIGIINQLNFMSQKMSEFTMLSMSEAVVKQIAENKDKKEVRELINASLKSYIVLVLSFMVFIIIVFWIFSEKLTIYVLGDLKYMIYFYIGLFAFPILILNSIPYAILKGFKDVKSISIAKVGTAVINLIVFLPLVLLFKLKGAVIYLPLSYLISLLINYLITRKKHLIRLNIGLKTIFRVRMRKSFVRELFLFSGFGLTIGSYTIISEFVCRSIVVSHLSVDAIGLYRPIIAWSSLFTGFLIASFSTYLFPRFAETKTDEETVGILNDAIRLNTFLLLPFLFLGIPYRNLLITIFYSKEFLEAGNYLPLHFIGMIFYVWWYNLALSLTPTGRIKQHAFFMFLYLTLDIGVTFVTVPVWGLYGWMMKHLLSPVVFSVIYYLYLRKSMKFRLSRDNVWIMLYLFSISVILSVSLVWKDFFVISYFLGPLLLFSAWFLLKDSEKKLIYGRVMAVKKKVLRKN